MTEQNEEVLMSNDSTNEEAPHDELQKLDEMHEDAHESEIVLSTTFQEFEKALESHSEPEKKLELAIQFLEATLSQPTSPHFKDFWSARKVCLDLFHANVNPAVRVSLWEKYSSLCQEAKRLKDIYDEQSAFNAEQIEIAVKSISDDIQNFPKLLEKSESINIPGNTPNQILLNGAKYQEIQLELNLLNIYATKTNALRKELIKTGMRIKVKNNLFHKLSNLGNHIFPRRKSLIHDISVLFQQDVEKFIKDTFSHEMKTHDLYDVREQIKSMQSLAKVFTLNAEVFSQTRIRLSECWDSVKNILTERKRENQEKISIFRERCDAFIAEIEEVKTKIETHPKQETHKLLDDITHRIRKTELGKQEIRLLSDKIFDVRSSIDNKEKEAKDGRIQETLRKEKKDQSIKSELLNSIEDLHKKLEELSTAELHEQFEALEHKIENTKLSLQLMKEVEKKWRALKDLAADRREGEMLSTATPSEMKDQIKKILKEKFKRRGDIKGHLEAHRHRKATSGFDIKAALEQDEMIELEREKLEKIEHEISVLQEKLLELKDAE